MDVKAEITSQEEWSRTVAITVPAEHVDQAWASVTKRYQKEAKVPGFRPGKAPASVVSQRYADAILQDVIENVIPVALDSALKQLEINPLGAPTLTNLSPVSKGSEMSFEATVDVRPEFEITGYKGISLKKQVYTVTDEDIERAIDSLRDSQATTIEVQRPAREGDVVVCNLQKIHDRLNRVTESQFDGITIELREGKTRPEFLKGLVGMGVGEGKEIEVNYDAEESDPKLAGNTVLYRAWMKTVSQKQLPAADDEFAKKASDGRIETMARLRELVTEDLKRRAENISYRDLRAQTRKAVVDANPVPVPSTFMNRYLDDITNRLKAQNPGVTSEAIRAQFEPMATEQFRWDIVLYEIAAQEEISVGDDEIKGVLDSWPADAGEKPDVERVRSTLLENKVYDRVIGTAEIEEIPYTPPSRIITPS